MLYITKDGIVDAEKIKVKLFPNIEGRQLKEVNGIVVHQTASPTAQSTFNSYSKPGANGAHFKKSFPNRYPMNEDSIGIEIVSAAPGDKGNEIFDPVTEAQNDSLGWLVKELADTFGVSMQEVYRHPEIGRKNLTEASTANW